MKTLGRNQLSFPETHDEAINWKRITIHAAITQHVLCVAQTRIEGCWIAYCDSVPGHDHEYEQELVLSNGDVLREALARVIYPVFDGIPYR